MALTVISTPAATDANSYVSVAEADAYFEGRLNASAWNDADAGTKDQAVVTATARLEQETYKGYLSTVTQRLKWPRLWVLREGSEYGVYWDNTVVPEPIKQATYELALSILNAGTTDALADTGLEGFTSVTLGPIAVQRDARFKGGQLPENVRRLIALYSESVSRTVRLLRS